MVTIKTLQEKWLHELSAMQDAERRFLDMQQALLPRVRSHRLQRIIETHIEQSADQVANLLCIFADLGVEPQAVCDESAIGLTQQATQMLQHMGDNAALGDCVIAEALIRIEHFEATGYRNLIIGAQLMGATQVAQRLRDNAIHEEEAAQGFERVLPELLQSAINSEAYSLMTGTILRDEPPTASAVHSTAAV